MWKAKIEHAGAYSLEVYIERVVSDFPDRGSPQALAPDYHYTVISSAGEEEIEFDAGSAGSGWQKLGTFTLTAGEEVTVKLSDKGSGLITADAIRWVPLS